MADLYLTRTIHLPVTADGRTVKNSFGVVIAHCANSFVAEAMARIMNLGHDAAKAHDAEIDAREERVSRLLTKPKAQREG